MGTEETKSTTATAENNITTTQKVAYGEEKIKSDEEEEKQEKISSREKKPADVSNTTTTAPDLKIEEEKNVIVEADNQQPPVRISTSEERDEIRIQTYSEPPPLTKKEDDSGSLSMKAHQAEESVLDVVDAVGVKAGSFAKEKFGELKKSMNPSHMGAIQDSQKIQALGPIMVEELARAFEDTTTIIRKVPYEEQVKLLTGYKKLLEEQIRVIDSRIDMSKRLK
jgi:hypothetical protein